MNMDIVNFLEETEAALADVGAKLEDAIYIGTDPRSNPDVVYTITPEEFRSKTSFEYDSGFGGQVIAYDLIIVLPDGTILHRTEYDGAENWEVARPFSLPVDKEQRKIEFFTGSSATLEEING